MAKGINLRGIELKNRIMEAISEQQLPPIVVEGVLEGILSDVRNATVQIAQKEASDFENESKDSTSKTTKKNESGDAE